MIAALGARQADVERSRRADSRVPGEALGVFTSREAAEEFVRDDPFVRHGVVAGWTVRPWNEILQP